MFIVDRFEKHKNNTNMYKYYKEAIVSWVFCRKFIHSLIYLTILTIFLLFVDMYIVTVKFARSQVSYITMVCFKNVLIEWTFKIEAHNSLNPFTAVLVALMRHRKQCSPSLDAAFLKAASELGLHYFQIYLASGLMLTNTFDLFYSLLCKIF